MIQSANGLGPQTIGRYSVSAHLSPPFLPPKTHFFFRAVWFEQKESKRSSLCIFIWLSIYYIYIYIYTQNVGPPNSQKTPVGDPDEMKDRPLSGLVGLR